MTTCPQFSSAFARSWIGAIAACGISWSAPTFAAGTINGQVLGAGAPFVGSTVTLWAENAGAAPRQLAQTQSDSDGRFVFTADGNSANLYLIAKGGRSAAIRQAATTPQLPPPLPDKSSIAVLPFENMSDDPKQEYFADGMVEEIITALLRFDAKSSGTQS